MASLHRLQRGIHGYLIRFSPHAFAVQCQESPSELPSPLVFLPISTDFTPTPAIPLTPAILKSGHLLPGSLVKREAFKQDVPNHLPALYAQ